MKHELKVIGSGALAGILMASVTVPSKAAIELGHAPPAALAGIVKAAATSTSTTIGFVSVTVPNTILDQVYEVEIAPPGRFQVVQRST